MTLPSQRTHPLPHVTLVIVTAVLPTKAQHLLDCVRSVAAARRITESLGYTLEHLVVLDGPGAAPVLVEDLDHLGVRTLALAAHGGTSAARNAAVAELHSYNPTATWVMPLDGDDTLDLEGWEQVLRSGAFRDESIGWVGTNRLTTTGERRTSWIEEPRRYDVHEFPSEWARPFQIHPNSVAVRLDVVYDIGAWMGLQGNEDTAWFILAASAAPGRAEPGVVCRYRVWEGQTTNDGWFSEGKDERHELIVAIVNTRRRRDGLAPIRVPAPAAGSGHRH